jgi:hypothetical protein
MCLSFKIGASPRQRSHSPVRVPWDSWLYFTVSDSRLPQPGGPDPSIYIPQEQSGPDKTPGIGFPFRRLLRLAGLRWRYSNPPPNGILTLHWVAPTVFKITPRHGPLYYCRGVFTAPLHSSSRGADHRKHRSSAVACMLWTLPSNGRCLQSHR